MSGLADALKEISNKIDPMNERIGALLDVIKQQNSREHGTND